MQQYCKTCHTRHLTTHWHLFEVGEYIGFSPQIGGCSRKSITACEKFYCSVIHNSVESFTLRAKKLIKTLKQFKYHISQISLFDWMASLILENIIHEMQVQHIGSFNLNTFVKLVKFAKSVVQKYNLSVEGSSYRFFGLLFHLCFLLLTCFLQEKLDYKCNFISLELHLCELR